VLYGILLLAPAVEFTFIKGFRRSPVGRGCSRSRWSGWETFSVLFYALFAKIAECTGFLRGN
jgi:hypothetical protein